MKGVSFADDLTVCTIADNEDDIEKILRIQAEEFERYFKYVGLRVNGSKNEHLVVGAKRSRKVVVEGREEAKEVPKVSPKTRP